MAIRETLQAWLRQGYTANETPLDGYGAEVVREVLAALSSAPPDLVPEHVRKHSREVVDMYRGLKPREQVSRGTLEAMAIGLLERWLAPAPETPAPVAPVDHAPMGMPGDAGHDQWGYPLSLRTSVPDSSPVAPAPPVAETLGPWPADYIGRAFVAGASWWQFHKNGSTAWGSERKEMESEAERRYGPPASPVVAPAPVVGCAWTPDDDTSSWDTACGRKWTFLEDGPTENRVDYCMGCGKLVALSPRETPNGGGR